MVKLVYRTALVHRRQKRVKEEIKFLKEAVKIYPEHGKSNFSLAEVYDNLKVRFNAVVHFITMARGAFIEQEDKRGDVMALQMLEKLSKKYGLNIRDFVKVRLFKK